MPKKKVSADKSEGDRIVCDLTQDPFKHAETASASSSIDILKRAFEQNKISAQKEYERFIRDMDNLKTWVLEVIEDSLPENVHPVIITTYLYGYAQNVGAFTEMLTNNVSPAIEFTADDGHIYVVLLAFERDVNGQVINRISAFVKRKDPITGIQEAKLPNDGGWVKET